MKEKIKAALKTKYPGVHGEVIDWAADHLASTVTKEEDIQGAIDGSDGLIKSTAALLQKETDRRVTEAIKKKETELKAEQDKKTGGEPDQTKQMKKDDDAPAWASKIIEANEKLSQEIEKLKTEKTAGEFKSVLLTKLKEKEIPEKYYSNIIEGRSFKEENDVEALASKIETGWTLLKQSLSDINLGQTQKPIHGAVTKDGVSSAVKEYLDESKDGKDSGMGSKPLNIDKPS